MKIAKVISNLLLEQHGFCCLCFKTAEKDVFNIYDEIILQCGSSLETTEIADMLKKVLGERYTRNLRPTEVVCCKCTEAAKTSYSFIKMCESNCDVLTHSLDTLVYCLDNIDSVKDFGSIFIHSNTSDFSSEQYYDKENVAKYPKVVLERFNYLIYNNRKQKRRKDVKDPKEKRTRIHNYSEEMAKICDVIRETNRSKFRCKVCSAVFSKTFNFKKHYFSRHSMKTITCSECGKCYGSESLLRQHKYDSHANIMCNQCGKTYKNRYSLLYHMRQHSGEQPYECPHCDMKFQWSSRRAEHIRRYHLEPGAECDICHVKFRTLGSLYEHRKRHFNPNSRLHVTQETPPVAEEQEIEMTSEVEELDTQLGQ